MKKNLLIFIVASLILQGCANTNNHSSTTTLKNTTNHSSKIVLMPIDVELMELTALGSTETRADWTENAKGHMQTMIKEVMSSKNANMEMYAPENTEFDSVDSQLVKLHEAVGYSVLVHHFGQLQLPSKKKVFDWSLGKDAKSLAKNTGANYALFVFVRDSYSTGGRVAMQVFGAILGIGISGGVQVGFASLVDLESGDIVWFNRLVSTTGDMRKAKGAEESVTNLLDSFPTAN